jgi:hypothetical protein
MMNITLSYAVWHLLGNALVNFNNGYVSALGITTECFTTDNSNSTSSVARYIQVF